MTKRRRHKICKIMSCAYPYVAKGKFEYLLNQEKLYRKHKAYLTRMSRREFDCLVEELLTKYGCKE